MPASTSSRRPGRIYSYDVTGGCYVEGGHHSTGSGSVFARGALKKLWRPGLEEEQAVVGRHRGALRRRRRRLGHRGPRPRPPDLADRGRRRPLRRAVRRAGRPRGARAAHRRGPSRQPGRCPMSMPFYVPPEQVMKDRADFARKGIARGRSVIVRGLRQAASPSSPRTPRAPCTRCRRSTTASPSRRSGATTSSRACGSPASATPTCAATPTTAPTSRPGPSPTRMPRRSGPSSPRSPSPSRSRSSSPRSGSTADSDQIFRLTYDGSVADEQGFVAMGGASEAAEERLGTGWRPGMTLGEVLRLAVDVLGAGENGERRALGRGPARGRRARPRPSAPLVPAHRRSAAHPSAR